MPASPWPALKALAAQQDSLRQAFSADPDRANRFRTAACGITLDYSKNLINEQSWQALQQLAANSNIQPVAIDFTPGADPLNVLTSAVTGILRYPFAPAVMPIELPAGMNVVAGIPTATFEIAPPADMLMNPVCNQIYSGSAMSPIGLAGLEPKGLGDVA